MYNSRWNLYSGCLVKWLGNCLYVHVHRKDLVRLRVRLDANVTGERLVPSPPSMRYFSGALLVLHVQYPFDTIFT